MCENSSRGNILFIDSLGLRVFWETQTFTGFNGAGKIETTGNHAFSLEPLGWKPDINISSGTAWMGSRERYLFGQEREQDLDSRENLLDFPEEVPDLFLAYFIIRKWFC